MQIMWGPHEFNQRVADWLIAQFPEVAAHGRFAPYASIALIDDDGNMAGAVTMTGFTGFDAKLSIYAPGWRWSRYALRDLFSWCFEGCGLKRITVECSVKNERAIEFVRRLGFVREGTKRLGYAGIEHLALFGMTRSDCKFL